MYQLQGGRCQNIAPICARLLALTGRQAPGDDLGVLAPDLDGAVAGLRALLGRVEVGLVRDDLRALAQKRVLATLTNLDLDVGGKARDQRVDLAHALVALVSVVAWALDSGPREGVGER